MKHTIRVIKPNSSKRYELEFDDVDGMLRTQFQVTLIGPISRGFRPERLEIGVVEKEEVKILQKVS